MRFFLFFIIAFFALESNAQSDSTAFVVRKDPRMDVLLKKQGEANVAIRRANARTARGYRLLVANTNKRDEAIAAKTKVYTNFPELKAYLSYQSPYFKLKVGNFKTRDEAKQYQTYLQAFFPKGVFIMNDTIEVTPEKDRDDE